ncbi:hypothetical protein VTJ83DRAFT_3391 [Remersonia thermophila]|uniref:Uncharacterized protein n=1 Tax=Remersonia thermophila TaxID=72144 RepID=A0ABR4DEJ0_9PEZI
MDDSRGQRRQNEPPPMYGQRHPQRPQQRSAYQPTASDRFRQPTMGAPSPSGTARGMNGSTGYSGYYQDTGAAAGFPAPAAMAQGTMGYHSAAHEYGQADSRQSQSFGSTYPQMMYNVQQTGGPQSGGVYDASQPYSSRQAAGLPMMTTDVTAPYFPGESSNVTGPSSLSSQAAGSSSATQVYQQPGLHGYSAGNIPSAIGAMPTQTAAPDVRMEEGYAPATTALDESYAQYQGEVKGIFENIRNSNLTAASEALLRVSEWLLSHVVDLGLTTDNQSLHDERITLWNDFNHAWLALFQRQKEMMEAGLHTVQRPQTVVSQETLKKMGKELVRLCDNIERHGLVDYQYGVWEEQIVDILEECLDLYETQQNSAAGGNEGTSNSHRR